MDEECLIRCIYQFCLGDVFPATQTWLGGLYEGAGQTQDARRGRGSCEGCLDVMRLLLLNLCLQVFLISQDVLLPLGDGLVLTHPNFLRHLEERWSRKASELLERFIVVLRKLIVNYNHTCWISLKSWLTSIMPPSNSLTASARASIVSMSKWLVGSSRNNMCGFCQASQAKHTRHFWPSDRFLMGLTCGTFQTFLLKPWIFF